MRKVLVINGKAYQEIDESAIDEGKDFKGIADDIRGIADELENGDYSEDARLAAIKALMPLIGKMRAGISVNEEEEEETDEAEKKAAPYKKPVGGKVAKRKLPKSLIKLEEDLEDSEIPFKFDLAEGKILIGISRKEFIFNMGEIEDQYSEYEFVYGAKIDEEEEPELDESAGTKKIETIVNSAIKSEGMSKAIKIKNVSLAKGTYSILLEGKCSDEEMEGIVNAILEEMGDVTFEVLWNGVIQLEWTGDESADEGFVATKKKCSKGKKGTDESGEVLSNLSELNEARQWGRKEKALAQLIHTVGDELIEDRKTQKQGIALLDELYECYTIADLNRLKNNNSELF